jgi:hypothetical protein
MAAGESAGGAVEYVLFLPPASIAYIVEPLDTTEPVYTDLFRGPRACWDGNFARVSPALR